MDARTVERLKILAGGQELWCYSCGYPSRHDEGINEARCPVCRMGWARKREERD